MGFDPLTLKKLENLYAGITDKRLIGGIDIDWVTYTVRQPIITTLVDPKYLRRDVTDRRQRLTAASQKPCYFQIWCEGETVLFIDLKILLLGHVHEASVIH